ncbi:MAG: TRAP transporter substrate-binding protein DctP [Desulfatibacillum sp.]|nr:TRAP transporter substrate-binding protein DctP [Desulfatibacillum sp.]
MKQYKLLILCILVFCVFFGADSALAASMTNGSTATYKWKFATLAPRGVGWAKQVEEILFPAIMEECQGDLFVKVYWGGVLGDDKDVVAMIQDGRLSGGGFAGQGAALLCPEFVLFELPFLFNNYAEVDYIKEKMQPALDKACNRKGIKLILWNDQDFDQIYSTSRPISTLEDFKESTFIAWYGPLEERLLHRLGASTLRVDVPQATSALRQGKANAGIGPAIWVAGTQLYSVVRYVNPIKIRYSPAPIAASLDSWRSLPEDYRSSLMSRQKELQDAFCQGVRRDNDKSLQAMLQYGVEEVRLTQGALKQIRSKALPTWEDMVGSMYSRELLDEMLMHLETYRAQTP